jgi:ribonuclease Z
VLQLGGVAIDAISVGGLETSIGLPGLKLAFDLGVCRPQAVALPTVLFTHAHIDHMGALVQHCATRSLMGMRPPTYAFPQENLGGVEDLLRAWRRLDRAELPCALAPAAPGTVLPLPGGRRAVAFRSVHRVPCLGWAIWQTTRRLRPELQAGPDTPGRVKSARAAGEEVELVHDAPLIAFTGDTLIEVVEREPVVREARVLVIECSFVDDAVPVARAREMGHIHLDEIIERADLFDNEHLLFTHLSARYDARATAELLARRLPPGLRERVTLLPNLRSHR